MSINKSEFKDIIAYYDETRYDYKVAWDDSPTPAVHFGYYLEGNEKHQDALMNTNRALADMVGIKTGDKVLDAGCGKGGSCFWLAMNYNVEAVGITPVQSQIDDCRTQAKKLKLENQTTFYQADYCNTPFEKESFDVVWACESLCHARDKSKFYQEAYRILKPGGRIIIAEYLRTDRPLATKQEQLLKGWLNRWAIEDIDSSAEHQSHAKNAGFQELQIRDVTNHMEKSLRILHNNSNKWLWAGKLLRRLRIRTKVQYDNMYASVLQYQALQQQLWFYAFITAQKK